jgi:hypothetical protein
MICLGALDPLEKDQKQSAGGNDRCSDDDQGVTLFWLLVAQEKCNEWNGW